MDNELTIPSYPLILADEDIKYMKAFCKMYQLYHSLDKVILIDHTYFKNHTVSITEEKENVTFPWLEFLLFEIVELINNIHTETEGVFKKIVTAENILKKLDFEMLWEAMEDWSADLTLEDFNGSDNLYNVDYIFKMFKCTEHYVTMRKKMPNNHATDYFQFKKDIDKYYNDYIEKKPVTKEEVDKTIGFRPNEIDTGTLPTSTVSKPNPGMVVLPKIFQKAMEVVKPKESDPEPEPTTVAELTDIKSGEYGIYEG